MIKEPSGHIMQIVGEPVGGIRRHVHSILFGLRDVPGLSQSYVCAASGGDAGYRADLPALQELLPGRLLTLEISKKPCLRDILNVWRLAGYIKKEGVTLVHGHGAKGGAYARLLAAFCGVKAVYTPHGGAVHRMFGAAEEFVYTAAEKALLRFTDYCLFESRYSAEAYFAKVGKKPRAWSVNHNGIPAPDMAAVAAEAQKLGPAGVPGEVRIGVFGILRPQKGQASAVKAAAELAARGIKFRLHFYGRGPDREALEAEVLKLGLGGKVVFHGEVENPAPHMDAMDIVLIPSLFESFGYVAVEAFALKKAVAAASAGGLREIVSDGETGLLFEPGDYLAMARSLEKLAADSGLRLTLSERGNARYQKDFTEERMIAGIKAAYFALTT